MTTYEQAKIALDCGKGKGSYRFRKDGSKIHLAYRTTGFITDYAGYRVDTGTSEKLYEEDIIATDWVIE